MKIIFDYNRTIFDPETDDLYQGVFELISDLSKKYELYLVSANEPRRKEKIKDLNIDSFFKGIFFVENKSLEVFKMIADIGEEVLVVGDNIYSEISTGNKMHFITVLIKQGKFSNLLPRKKEEKPKHTINNIRELKEILKGYEK